MWRMTASLFVSLCFVLLSGLSPAASPRFVAGAAWTNVGRPMGWYRTDVHYFVDAGPLSASVDHAAGLAMVDAAAGVWNIAGVDFTLTNGGSLSEDVSGDNVYLGANGPVWPADAAKTNYAAKQIAVIFDADGAVTDALLGAGASDPGSCRTNGVTESTDLFLQPGKIAHALIIINGLCSGSAPEKQLQLRYQLMRVFGRVIGLGWSQLNDNVFTGTPQPTYLQQLHWPVMHPIDILCGPYTYQCLPEPFTLRDDDIAGVRLLYTDLTRSTPGWIQTSGTLRFPNGQGMAGVNVTLTRNYPWNSFGTETFQDASAVSGIFTAGDRGNPVTGASADTDETNGSTAANGGYFLFGGIPALPQFPVTSLYYGTEPINPLYVGSYAVGPYRVGTPAPSGTPLNVLSYSLPPGYVGAVNLLMPDATRDCTTGADGTESQPARVPEDGVWSGRLCGVGHTSWLTLPVRAGRSATVEVVATDETGAATTSKAMPLLALWHGSDATGTLPTLARASVAFNGLRTGTTQLRATFTVSERIRLAVTDTRGEGRPDFTYQARVLYADTVTPARLTGAGGAIRIVGMGFQRGNTVTVGGVAALITNLSSTEIDAIAPPSSQLRATGAVDVIVNDLQTGGSTVAAGALTYDSLKTDILTLLSAPAPSLDAGASAPLMLRLKDSRGEPAPNGTIELSASGAAVIFSACHLASCTLVTDNTGLVTTQVTPQAAGSVTLLAKSKGGSFVTASFVAKQEVHAVTALRPTAYVAAGSSASFAPAVRVTTNAAASSGQTATWSTASPRIALTASSTQTGPDGVTGVSATSTLRDGESSTVQACAWKVMCATQNVRAVAPADLRMEVVSGGDQSLQASDTLDSVVLRVVDAFGHPVAGALTTIYQSVVGWQPVCAPGGRCSTAPIYGKSTGAVTSDDDGLLTVAPLQYRDTAALTKLTAVVGTGGSVTVTLQKRPSGQGS
jgi:hypothetical protein